MTTRAVEALRTLLADVEAAEAWQKGEIPMQPLPPLTGIGALELARLKKLATDALQPAPVSAGRCPSSCGVHVPASHWKRSTDSGDDFYTTFECAEAGRCLHPAEPEGAQGDERAEIEELRRQLRFQSAHNHLRNLELDALHYVWCNGGCKYGVHRWTDEAVTEELVATAERNTARLRTWLKNKAYRDARTKEGGRG